MEEQNDSALGHIQVMKNFMLQDNIRSKQARAGRESLGNHCRRRGKRTAGSRFCLQYQSHKKEENHRISRSLEHLKSQEMAIRKSGKPTASFSPLFHF